MNPSMVSRILTHWILRPGDISLRVLGAYMGTEKKRDPSKGCLKAFSILMSTTVQ